MNDFKVVEIFRSIDGEGIRTGLPVTFIRLFGCNLRCNYCDTNYSYGDNPYTTMDTYTILNEVGKLGVKRITLTGGEPLIQDNIKELIDSLLLNDYEVNIETNGAVDLYKFQEYKYNKNVIFTMDYKCKGSGMNEHMWFSNFKLLREQDVLKFVVSDEADLDSMRVLIRNLQPKARVFVSPVFGRIEPCEIVDYILKHELFNVTTQVQLHKIIWNPNERGV